MKHTLSQTPFPPSKSVHINIFKIDNLLCKWFKNGLKCWKCTKSNSKRVCFVHCSTLGLTMKIHGIYFCLDVDRVPAKQQITVLVCHFDVNMLSNPTSVWVQGLLSWCTWAALQSSYSYTNSQLKLYIHLINQT